ncbi:OPT oligopeptide transporter protein-domain-containing protein [Mycena rebaudengoi]|nr:OPT oligopeptide transporter protein-domain-containing protein [Mycena rebaudengoi]
MTSQLSCTHRPPLAPDLALSYGFVTTWQTIGFASDLKLAHYCHIPPRLIFAVISTFICTAILNFQITKIPDVCTPHQADHFTCPGVNTFFTASVLWGALGPKRMFGWAASTTGSSGAP